MTIKLTEKGLNVQINEIVEASKYEEYLFSVGYEEDSDEDES